MPVVTEEMANFANFMETYVEPTMLFFVQLASLISPAIQQIASIFTALVSSFVPIAG